MSSRPRFNTRFIGWILASLAGVAAPLSAQDYYPSPHEWETRSPEEVGMDSALLDEAIRFIKGSESENPRDLREYLTVRLTSEPHSAITGPVKERGGVSGVILRHGYIVAEWGEPDRVDMTFSVTKSFLSTTVGLAYDRGLIRDVQDRVQKYVPLEHFNSEHNAKITWNHLLRQTSDWEGTLWGKPDWADRPGDNPAEWLTRARHEPGTVYKYNDVRVNVLALAALEVWRRPLPKVLKEYVMDPIGASNTWRWHGYEDSWATIDGLKMQSVSGGGHWGGGMFISARDQARFGHFTLRRGKWKGQRLLSEEWFEMANTPTKARPGYGFMNFFLNTDREMLPSAPENAFCHLGSGTNMVCVLPDQDLVVVARWIKRDAEKEFIQKILESIKSSSATN